MSKATPPEVPVRFYRSGTGREPCASGCANWEGDRRAIGLDRMRVQFRWPIGMPLVRSLKDGLWDVRFPAQPALCAAGALLPRSDTDRAAWIYQEDAEDSSRRPGACETKDERGDEMKKQNKHLGSSLDDFLKQEGDPSFPAGSGIRTSASSPCRVVGNSVCRPAPGSARSNVAFEDQGHAGMAEAY